MNSDQTIAQQIGAFAPGWAGVAGITAAVLVENGFKAPPRAYEGRYGLYALYTPEGTKPNLDVIISLGTEWQMLKVGIKPLPACHFTHAFSDAAIEVAQAHDLDPDQVNEIVVRVPEGIVGVVCEPEERKQRPLNSYEAQFSLHYIVASSLVRKRFTLQEIQSEAISDPALLRLASRVHYEVDPEADYPRYFPGDLTIRMRDGTSFSAKHPQHRGSDTRPLSREDIISKFRSNTHGNLPARQIEQVISAVDTLDEAPDLGALMDAVSIEQA